MPRHPLTRLSSRTIYRGRVLRLDADRVQLPNGLERTMELVRHRGSVVLLPEPRPGRLILVRQYRYAIRRWIWELPAGTLEPRETPGRAARRECEEEIGLRPRVVTRLAEFYPTPGFCDERMVFYRCTDLIAPARPRAGDDDEALEPCEFTVPALRRMIARREIVDMKTVVGLWLIGPGARAPGP